MIVRLNFVAIRTYVAQFCRNWKLFRGQWPEWWEEFRVVSCVAVGNACLREDKVHRRRGNHHYLLLSCMSKIGPVCCGLKVRTRAKWWKLQILANVVFYLNIKNNFPIGLGKYHVVFLRKLCIPHHWSFLSKNLDY